MVFAAAAVALWWAVSLGAIAGRPLIAGPFETLVALAAVAGPLALDLACTLARAATGLLLGTVLGLLLGLAAAAAARSTEAPEGALELLRSIPPVVWLPLFLLGLGYTDAARIATVTAAVSLIMAAAVTTAAKAPASLRVEQLRLARASPLQLLRWTQPWESLPALLVGLRIATAMAIIVATVAEMLAGAPHGIGSRIVDAQVAQDTPQLTAAIAALGLAGFALGRGLRWAELTARALASGERRS
ncbi:MAG: ABC transporter permease subunit [Archangiaceae bacterium]|nr:ABC transporter permease subunit [Archangiaceae bacterium]